MAFLNLPNTGIYLKIETTAKIVRPLTREAVSKWVRNIPACKKIGADGKPKTVRSFKSVDGDFSNFFRNNPDPLWEFLDTDDKFDREGNRRDFPASPKHIIPVWSYSDNDIKILKGGNQVFKEMDEWETAGNDVTACDWAIMFEATGRFNKEYKTARMDVAQFQWPLDENTMRAKISAAMEQAISDLVPFKTEEEMIRYINGDDPALDFNPNQLEAQGQTQIPGYMPGGQPGMALGAAPALPPAQQPVPVTAPQYPPQQLIPGVTTTTDGQMPIYNTAPSPTAPLNTVPNPATPPNTTMPGMMPSYNIPANPNASASMNAQMPQPMPQQMAPQTPQPLQDQQQQVQNAPVTSAPVFAPPVAPPQQTMPQPTPQQQSVPQQQPVPQSQPVQQTQISDPSQIAIDFGKHKGHTLGFIKENDPQYLSYLKGNKPELADAIGAVLGAVESPVPQQQPQQQDVMQTADVEEHRSQLVKEINEMIVNIPDFQGPGIHNNLMPFLNETIGTANFSDAPLDKLQVLKTAIDGRFNAGA